MSSVQKDPIDSLWREVDRRDTISLSDWLNDDAGPVSSTSSKREQKARQDLGAALRFPRSSTKDNFLLNMLRYNTKHVRLMIQFVRVMSEREEQWSEFLRLTLELSGVDGLRSNGIIHELAKCGYCRCVERFLNTTSANLRNKVGETPLHFAAASRNMEDVEILLRAGAKVAVDEQGYSPLHWAAMSIQPNSQVARHLVNAIQQHNKSLLYARTKKQENTALHVAAGNVNMTAEFIQELEIVDPRIKNIDQQSPFHIAAKSENSSIIVEMLRTFRPADHGWNIDYVDSDYKMARPVGITIDEEKPREILSKTSHLDSVSKSETLLDLCAKKGNTEAIELLIQNGANISRGVLHTIVYESVRRPDKVDKLKAVYKAIVDNVVIWYCLVHNEKLPTNDSQDYSDKLWSGMVHLLSHCKQDGMDVFELAVQCGAFDMLQEIVNTRNVSRWDRYFDDDSVFTQRHFHRYDVTNFVRSTMIDQAESELKCANCNVQVSVARSPGSKTIDTQPRPYIKQIIESESDWQHSGILNTEPFRTLCAPFSKFAQVMYLLSGAFHIAFMIAFSVYFINKIDCNEKKTACENGYEGNIGWWLLGIVLPVFIVAFYLAVLIKYLVRRGSSFRSIRSRIVKREHWFLSIVLILADMFPAASFWISLFIWYSKVTASECNCTKYLQVKAMVFLFGWLTTFMLFSGATKAFYVFKIVLKEIIVKDILMSFMLVFTCAVVGFAFALHVLLYGGDMKNNCEASHINATVYTIFLAAFSMGDFYESMNKCSDKLYSNHASFGFVRVVFGFYICFTTIILLNVLIAMMSNRYEQAKRRAMNEWRFDTVWIGMILTDVLDRCHIQWPPTMFTPITRCPPVISTLQDARSRRFYIDVRSRLK